MSVEGWRAVGSWEDEQPQECSVCGDVLTGSEVGYIPSFCQRDGCPGPAEQLPSVSVVPRAPVEELVAAARAADCTNDRATMRLVYALAAVERALEGETR